MGLTQDPDTGKLLAQWLRQGQAEIDLQPYSLARFD